MDTTWEEAKRCPRCKNPGVEISRRPGPHGSALHTIQCKTERCQWFNTTYIVQVMSDGSVANPTIDRDKSFPKLPDRKTSATTQAERLYEQSLESGEIPNRYN